MISPSDDKTFPLVEPLLSWTSRRQQALSSNVANADTPGYHAQDYSFEAELSASLAMNTTSARHITPVQETPSARVFDVGTKEKANGNNVDMDRELTEMAKNGLQYVTLVQYLSQKLRTLRSAISDGGKV